MFITLWVINVFQTSTEFHTGPYAACSPYPYPSQAGISSSGYINAARLPAGVTSFYLIYRWSELVQHLDRGLHLHLTLCVKYKPCVLDVSPGVVCTCHGVPRRKVWRQSFLRWAPIYVARSHWHATASRNWKLHSQSSQQQRLLRILWSWNPMKWDYPFTSCDLSDVHMNSEFTWKFTERCSN